MMLEVHKFHEPGVPADSPRDDVYTSSTCTHAMDRRQLPTYTVALTCLQSIGRTLVLQAVLVIGHDLSLDECRRSTPLFCERSLLSIIGVYSRFIAKHGNLKRSHSGLNLPLEAPGTDFSSPSDRPCLFLIIDSISLLP
jgi:hypothetical protein